MSCEVKFESNVVEFLTQLENITDATLEEIGGEIEAKAKRKTPVGKVSGGKTKNSWKHKVNSQKHEVIIGNTEETAIWIELGTGDYALNGDGRKGGWFIPVGNGAGQMSLEVVQEYGFKIHHGKDGQDFVFTRGMKPKRVLHNAVESSKGLIDKKFKNNLGGLAK